LSTRVDYLFSAIAVEKQFNTLRLLIEHIATIHWSSFIAAIDGDAHHTQTLNAKKPQRKLHLCGY
jgi:hypothetical protein